MLASDNTLGAYSQFQGRIYAAFVDHVLLTGAITNPADNTDIFLEASDDGGLTWNALTPTALVGFIPNNFGFDDGPGQRRQCRDRRVFGVGSRRIGPAAVPAQHRGRPDDRDAGHVVVRHPQRCRAGAGGDAT